MGESSGKLWSLRDEDDSDDHSGGGRRRYRKGRSQSQLQRQHGMSCSGCNTFLILQQLFINSTSLGLTSSNTQSSSYCDLFLIQAIRAWGRGAKRNPTRPIGDYSGLLGRVRPYWEDLAPLF